MLAINILFLLLPMCIFQDTYWVKLNYPSNISVSSLEVIGSNIIIAGTYSKGVYISKDRGATWQESNNGLKCYDVRNFTINKNGDIYAGTTKGLYKSIDTGQNWELLSFKDKYIANIKINSKGYIYVCGPYLPIFYSVDNGHNWQSPKRGLENIGYVYGLAIKSDSIIFAGAQTCGTDPIAGVLRSTDYGCTWKSINSGLTSKEIDCIAVSLNGNVYVGIGQVYDLENSGLFLSKDNGDHWEQVIKMTCNYCYPLSLYTCFNRSVFFSASFYGNYYSDDDGYNWKDLNYNQLIHDTNCIRKDSINYLYINAENGIYRSVKPYEEE
jgi:photosystem II stability/assembly factor-like uncharacterized protein